MPRNWSREETVLAFNLYCKTPFTRISWRNKGVIELAGMIGRSPSSVALKLVNFASLDPALAARHVVGMRHHSKSDESVWREFHDDWNSAAFESERTLAERRNVRIEHFIGGTNGLPREGKEREAVLKVRVNQLFFRQMILASYAGSCCITGIAIPELLVASHIVPWAVDEKNRVNPCNGLCLNALHDKAFDAGLMTITPDFRVKLSRRIAVADSVTQQLLMPFEGHSIKLPQRFTPAGIFIEYHNQHIFLDR
jgi:putative restriction endonuclease